MKKLSIAALLGAQVLASAQPAAAAQLAAHEQNRTGAFAGVRLRVGLDGARSDRQLRAGVALAPAVRSERSDGAARTRFGEGLELGIGADRGVTLSLAGTRIDRLGMAPAGTSPQGHRAGVSTLGWVAIGVGTIVVVGLAGTYLWLDDALDCDDDDECN